jgi:ketosteroid isomerase-like protein
VTGVEVVTAFLAGLATDLDAAVALLADDFVVDEPASLPFGGVRTGPDGFRAVIGDLTKGYRLRLSNQKVRDAGDVVVVTLDIDLTSRATGRSVSMPLVDLYAVEDGRITRLDVFYKDTHEVLAINDATDASDPGSSAA